MASSPPTPNDDQRLRRRGIPKLPTYGVGFARYQALAASTLFHVAFLVTLGVLWSTSPKGTGENADRPVGIAVVHQVDGGEAYFLPESGASQIGQNQSSVAADVANSLPSNDVKPVNANDLLAGLLPSGGGLVGNVNDAVGGMGLADGGPRVGSSREIPKVKTSVFGVQGEGTRFIYVFDKSDSMNNYGGLPLLTSKRELVQSLKSLSKSHQFQIIFYNESPHPYGGISGGGAKMLYGDEPSKAQAISFVQSTSATGSTQHAFALKLAISMSPDVIFFLTDADQPALSVKNREEIIERCQRSGTTLHAIQFGVGPNQNTGSWIESLATETAGKYKYIDVSKPNFESDSTRGTTQREK